MSYNVKVIKYKAGGYQVRMYSETVGRNTYKPVDPKLELEYWDDDGILHTVTYGSETGRLDCGRHLSVNPFTGELEYIRSFEQAEHSERVSRNRTINNLYYDTRSNIWDWFVTLTFDPEKVDRYDYEAVTKKLHYWLSNCKKICPDMKYIVVPELHKDGAFHFHGLFADCEGLGFTDSGKYTDDGLKIYNIGKYRHGWTTATKVQSNEKVAKYMTKYITKDLCTVTKGKKRYWKSRNLEQAEMLEFTMTDDEKLEFLKSIAEYVQYAKTVEGEYLNTDYYELAPGVDIESPEETDHEEDTTSEQLTQLPDELASSASYCRKLSDNLTDEERAERYMKRLEKCRVELRKRNRLKERMKWKIE